MSVLLKNLKDVRRADVAQVGSKAAVLGTLYAAGFPVPSTLCVTTDAFYEALTPHARHIEQILSHMDLRIPEAALAAEKEIEQALANLSLSRGLAALLEAELAAVDADRFAVRSSATAEDLAFSSFAGQYATVLAVSKGSALHEAIVACWRSFYSAQAISARAIAGVPEHNAGMALLVQPLIDAECAGVCFSVDPVRLEAGLLLIEATWGLGIGAVEGSLPTDTIVVRRRDLAVELQEIADKTECYVRAEGEGIQRAPVSDDSRKMACLPDAWAKSVAAFALAAEQLLGAPQDVEWAIAGQRVWILQSRPITTLPAELARATQFPVTWRSDEESRVFWRLSAGSMHDLQLPLEHDYFSTFRQGWEEGEHFTGINEPTRGKVVNGRRYWAKGTDDLTPADRRVRSRAISDLNERLIQIEGKTAWDYWGPEVISAADRLRSFDVQSADGPALADHVEEAFAVARRNWMVHNLLGFPPIEKYLAAYTALTGESGPDALDSASLLLEGEDTVLTQLIDWLYRLAVQARHNPELKDIILDKPADALERLAKTQTGGDFLSDLRSLLHTYGDRTGAGVGSSVTLRTPSWREQPTLVLATIGNYLDPAVEAPAAARARAREKRDAEVDALCASCDDGELVAEFRRQLALLRKDATLLEEHNHYIDQAATGQVHNAVMSAGRWLAAHGSLEKPSDVFWLGLDELLASLRSQPASSCLQTVAYRQSEYDKWYHLEAPAILGVPPAQLPARPQASQVAVQHEPDDGAGSNRVRGKGASRGLASGRARVVSTGEIVPDVAPGDVLVAENAGPQWTPFFPVLSAIVLDKGAALQHAAVVAREYGIPMVVDTGSATRRIPEGAWIVVDGNEGFAEIQVNSMTSD